MKNHTKFGIIAASILMSACTSMTKNGNTQSDSASPNFNTAKVSANESSIKKEPLNGQILFQLLLAEIATNREEYGSAASLYTDLARKHNDVTIIQRAVALNQSAGNFEDMESLAIKWLELRPMDTLALRSHALSSIAMGNIDSGSTSLDQWLEIESNADISIILPAVQHLNDVQRNELALSLETLQSNHPKSATLLYSSARLAAFQSKTLTALSFVNKAIKYDDQLPFQLFKFQLLLLVDQHQEAKALIETLYKKNPTDRQIAIHYTRFIYRFEPTNLKTLNILHTRFATEPTIARSYARAAFDQGDTDAAQAVYLHLLKLGYSDEANYFLGRINVENHQLESAIGNFRSVAEPPYLSSALAEWTGLASTEDNGEILTALIEAKNNFSEQAAIFWRLIASYHEIRNDDNLAWEAFEQGISAHPEDISLLYDQAMFATHINKPAVTESNLSVILELDPNNVNALNALGYTWADLSKNLDSAGEYIDRALSLEPNNPAFLDSKGWYLYRIGQLDDALIWLQKAFDSMKNDEVAAHIAEVLWYLNRAEDAHNYLNKAIELNPNSQYTSDLKKLFNDSN